MTTTRDINNEDQILKNFFRNNFIPDDVPSENFNQQVMDNVMNEWVSQSNYYAPLVDKHNGWWIVPGVLALFIVGYFFDVGKFQSKEEGIFRVNDLAGTIQSLYSWVEPVHLIVIGAIIAIGLLLVLDHFLQKLSNI
jgi:hypothetical protein